MPKITSSIRTLLRRTSARLEEKFAVPRRRQRIFLKDVPAFQATNAKRFVRSFKPHFIKGESTFMVDLFARPRDYVYAVPLSVAVFSSKARVIDEQGVESIKQHPIFEARVKFNENGVILVREIQGAYGNSTLVKDFERVVGMPVANYLLSEIERVGKSAGYHTIQISSAESNFYFDHPSLKTKLMRSNKGKSVSKKDLSNPSSKVEVQNYFGSESAKIQRRMRALHEKVASSMGYASTVGGYIKKI
ncbi:MAG: hypothetical protein WCW44_04115 [archaeon]|jgi:hypothetical protein